MSRPSERETERRRGERGSATPLILGFFGILLLTIVVVVDASAAYLERQSLATMAEGAALQGADLGAQGIEVYTGGFGDQPLELTESSARAAVRDYLADVGAYRDHPGLSYVVRVTGARVEVSLTATLDLPLGFPGVDGTVEVTGTGSAIADPD